MAILVHHRSIDLALKKKAQCFAGNPLPFPLGGPASLWPQDPSNIVESVGRPVGQNGRGCKRILDMVGMGITYIVRYHGQANGISYTPHSLVECHPLPN